MSKKTFIAIFFIGIGVCAGYLTLSTSLIHDGNSITYQVFLLIAILCIVTGSILGFSRLLDRSGYTFFNEIHQDIQDDLQALKARRMTSSIWMVVILVITGLSFSFLVLRFQKLDARWGSMPVAVPTIAGVAALAWFVPSTRWFRVNNRYTPFQVFLIPTIGLFLSVVFGIAGFEHPQLTSTRSNDSIQYSYSPTYSLSHSDPTGIGDLLFLTDIPACDEDVCALIMLVMLTFILLIGSAFIPHFWFFSGSILLAMMALITIHDLLIRPDETKQPVYLPTR